MKPTPKILQVFLPKGTPAGIQIAELSTRVVQAASVPSKARKRSYKNSTRETTDAEVK